jgi:hypothetical protein
VLNWANPMSGAQLWAWTAAPAGSKIVPHLVWSLVHGHWGESSESDDGLLNRLYTADKREHHAPDFKPPRAMPEGFINAAHDLLNELGPVPFAPSDTHPSLWALRIVVCAIELFARRIGREPGNPFYRQLVEQVGGPTSTGGMWTPVAHGAATVRRRLTGSGNGSGCCRGTTSGPHVTPWESRRGLWRPAV